MAEELTASPEAIAMALAYATALEKLAGDIQEFYQFMLQQDAADRVLHDSIKTSDLADFWLAVSSRPERARLWDGRKSPAGRAAHTAWEVLSAVRPAVLHANLLLEEE